jgi:2-keto-myo-inositol isomerase
MVLAYSIERRVEHWHPIDVSQARFAVTVSLGEKPEMTKSLRYGLNHMVAPRLDLTKFFDLAKSLDLRGVEIRNDLEGNANLTNFSAAAIRDLADERGLEIVSINALQRFNDWNDARAQQARDLAVFARDCGAKALVLCPVNDPKYRLSDAGRHKNLRGALRALSTILDGTGVRGLVEPLGFRESSLRLKREAIDAIEDIGATDRFQLVHDTFHHHLAGEKEIFPLQTGLVHISGVESKDKSLDEIRDEDRVLVGPADILRNPAQIDALVDGGYAGYLSFEPFASSVHNQTNIEQALKGSQAYLDREIRRFII